MRQFRMQDPEHLDEFALVSHILARAEGFETLSGRPDTPAFILENQRELLDKACGEWVWRRKGDV